MTAAVTPVASASNNRARVALVLGLIALQVLVYFPTYLSMGQIWWRSETFSHGFLILPISAFLILRRRDELAALPLAPDLRALAPLLLLVLGWAVAHSGIITGPGFRKKPWRKSGSRKKPIRRP